MRYARAIAADALRIAMCAGVLALAACAGNPAKKPATAHAPKNDPVAPRKPWKPQGPYTPGGVYAPDIADGAPSELPDVDNLPEPVPHAEPLSRYGNRSPYIVLGKSYTVLPSAAGYDERGVASWYGTKFDGRMTSSLEPYDLTQFSAAHRTLPLPSYARVTNLENGRSVIVRINDRGPFHEGRLIDLSYAAAVKLGVNVHGTARVEVRGIDTGQDGATTARITESKRPARVAPAIGKTTAEATAPGQPASEPVAASMPAVATTTPLANPSAVDEAVPLAPAVAPPASASSVSAITAATAAVNPPATMPLAPLPQPEHPPIAADTVGFLQIGSYTDAGNADRMLARLMQAGVEHAEVVVVQVNGQGLWRVHVGPFSAEQAERVAEQLDALGFGHPPFFKK